MTKFNVSLTLSRRSDLATMDASGRVRIVGRTKELIIRGGANIYPREIEEVLITHPLIHTAAVCGVPHKRLNETICCWIRFRDPKKTLTEKEVKVFCKEKVGAGFFRRKGEWPV